MCACDFNKPRVWNERVVCARGEHRCLECRYLIVDGEPHVRVGANHDGSWATHRFCLFCSAFAKEAQAAWRRDRVWGPFCWTIGELYGCVEERLRFDRDDVPFADLDLLRRLEGTHGGDEWSMRFEAAARDAGQGALPIGGAR